jgi:hypothetical protein
VLTPTPEREDKSGRQPQPTGTTNMPLYRVHYMTTKAFRDSSFDYHFGGKFPDVRVLDETHRPILTLDAAGLESVWHELNMWGETNDVRFILEAASDSTLGEAGEIWHTSMTVGDVVENLATGDFHMAAGCGFELIGERGTNGLAYRAGKADKSAAYEAAAAALARLTPEQQRDALNGASDARKGVQA